MILRPWVMRLLDLERIRLTAEAGGLSSDQVAHLEGHCEQLHNEGYGMDLATLMRQGVRLHVRLGIEPGPPVTMVDHFGVLRAHVRRLVTIAVIWAFARVISRRDRRGVR